MDAVSSVGRRIFYVGEAQEERSSLCNEYTEDPETSISRRERAIWKDATHASQKCTTFSEKGTAQE